MIKQIDDYSTLHSAIKTNSYMVGSQDALTGKISFAPNPIVHSNRDTARAECKRLAELTPNKLYFFVYFAGGEMVPSKSISI